MPIANYLLIDLALADNSGRTVIGKRSKVKITGKTIAKAMAKATTATTATDTAKDM
jgi:hypothetical protein